LLDAVDQSGRKNLVIVLWGDHGWHLGEKLHWRKFSLWEEATRAPLLFVAPGVTKAGACCDAPVDFMSIYPTLADLCSLPAPEHLDGTSLRPLLENPESKWDRAAITTHGRGNHAVRDDRWRYIRYADGSEELYDHRDDPNEWINLAGQPQHEDVKKRLAKWLPAEEAPDAPRMSKEELQRRRRRKSG
jgi:arylsulfatase A-like enzyme